MNVQIPLQGVPEPPRSALPQPHPSTVSSTQVAVRTNALTKRFGHRTAVDAIDLVVPAGSVVGYLGPNGAGKTTTLKMLAGLWRPTSGTATVLGLDCVRERERLQQVLGYLPGDFAGYPGMTGRQFLGLLARLRGGVPEDVVASLAERLAIDLDRRLGTLSHGNRQKVAIIQAFMHTPRVMLLDEPTTGLDPLMQQEFLQLVREARDAGATVLLSSHVLSEVAEVADHVAVVDNGRLMLSTPISALWHSSGRRMDLTFADPIPGRLFANLDGVQLTGVDGTTAHLRVQGSTAELLERAAPYGVIDIRSHEPELMDLLLGLYDAKGASSRGHRVRQSAVGSAS